MDYNPQESLENTINTMGTLLGVHPIVPWFFVWNDNNTSYDFTWSFSIDNSLFSWSSVLSTKRLSNMLKDWDQGSGKI